MSLATWKRGPACSIHCFNALNTPDCKTSACMLVGVSVVTCRCHQENKQRVKCPFEAWTICIWLGRSTIISSSCSKRRVAELVAREADQSFTQTACACCLRLHSVEIVPVRNPSALAAMRLSSHCSTGTAACIALCCAALLPLATCQHAQYNPALIVSNITSGELWQR